MFRPRLWAFATAVVGVLLAAHTGAQQLPMTDHSHMQHEQMMGRSTGGSVPTSPGQDAFGAIQEIVRILDADPATDWSKVDLERLRQHLIDMDDVTLHSRVKANPVTGGLSMDVTGAGRTVGAIRRMVEPHAGELSKMPEWAARTEEIPGGVRLLVTVKNAEDAKTLARIRGLGFIGLLTQGAHHQLHHLAMARGQEILGHGH
jgi:hypothetical protein